MFLPSRSIYTSLAALLCTMIRRLAPLPPIAVGAERLQVMRGQAQVPVIRERLDVVDIHARAVFRGAAAQLAGWLLCQMVVAQPLPFGRFVEPFHQARLCPLAADEGALQPNHGKKQQGNQVAKCR